VGLKAVSVIQKNNGTEIEAMEVRNLADSGMAHGISVALLTGGGDKPYAYGLATALIAKGLRLDLIGSDELEYPEFRGKEEVNFLNLRGDQRPDTSLIKKILRVSIYYGRLLRYTAMAKPPIFHVLWNNKFEIFDRTLLMLYYRLLGKKIVLTLHNVNARTRDANDTPVNRLTLRIQYRLADHMFVHTEKMKIEVIQEFGVPAARITVIPFGINNSVPNTNLTSVEAKRRLGICECEKIILFFGHIAPYKGLEYLISAFRKVCDLCEGYRLIIAGRPKNCEKYWTSIREMIREDVERGRVLVRAEFIPDEETEVYFKAADVLVLPYTHIYQSGVLFLGYSFGLPALASDVGSLGYDVVDGKTGFIFRPENAAELGRTIERYFDSDLYKNLSRYRSEIQAYAAERNSWGLVGETTQQLYAQLLQLTAVAPVLHQKSSCTSFDIRPR